MSQRAPDSGDALALFDAGRGALERGDLPLAIEKLSASVAFAPTAPALAALGEALRRSARRTDAVVHLAAAVGLGGGAALRARLAEALLATGDRPSALYQLREALREDPDHPDARILLRATLSDPREIARTANRHRLIEELRITVPEIPAGTAEPVAALTAIGRFVKERALRPGAEDALAHVFRFLNRLAVSPDQEVSDLLTGAVLPVLAEWTVTADLAGRLLIGKGRQAFEDALALWGPPGEEPPSAPATEDAQQTQPGVDRSPHRARAARTLAEEIAHALPRFRYSRPPGPHALGRALGFFIVDELQDAEEAAVTGVLTRLAAPRTPESAAALAAVVEAVVDCHSTAAIERLRRLTAGEARGLFERTLERLPVPVPDR